MPSSLRSTLLDRFMASLPGHLRYVDTANDEGPEKACGQAIHFDWYNRYSTLVSLIFFFFWKRKMIYRGMELQLIFTQVGFKSWVRSSGLQSLPQDLYPDNQKNYWTTGGNIQGL